MSYQAISTNINALIRAKTTSETVDRLTPDGNGGWTHTTAKHRVTHAPLLDQIQETVTTSSLTMDDTFTGKAGSKPPSRLDAIALVQRIDRESKRIVDKLHLRRGKNLTDRLSGISGAARDLTHDDTTWIAARTRSWLTAARIVTGWEAPPFTPDAPCPNIDCERRGTLRVRLEEQIAYCTECGIDWDPDNVTQLGTYVRWASEHLRGPRHWLTDPDGYPIECTECLDTRTQMAERKAQRQHDATWTAA